MNAHTSWRQRAFNVIAHRGASGHAPENTLSAFQKAIYMGADMVELDVHLSRDGELVVTHDESLEHLTNGFGYVKDYTVSELKHFEVMVKTGDRRPERIPTLREVFEFVGKRVGVVVEIKTGQFSYPGIEAKTARLLEEFDLLDDALVIAFYHPTLREIKRINPHIATGILYAAGLIEPWAVAETVGADALHPHFHYIWPEVVVESQKRGYRVHPWTIDSPDDLQRWKAFGVDGITTDFPDRLIEL